MSSQASQTEGESITEIAAIAGDGESRIDVTDLSVNDVRQYGEDASVFFERKGAATFMVRRR